MKLIMLGPPGSGKGTQAKELAKHYKIVHISTGEIFRESIKQKTALGKLAASLINDGKFIPDDVTNKLVEERLKQEDCKKGFILDGYPRTYNQAKFFNNLNYQINYVLNIEVSKKELIRRLSARRYCVDCKTNYNLIYIQPKKEGECDKCSGQLAQRKDDEPEAIKKRLVIYHTLTEPLIKFYKEKNLLININGEQKIEKVFSEIIEKLFA